MNTIHSRLLTRGVPLVADQVTNVIAGSSREDFAYTDNPRNIRAVKDADSSRLNFTCIGRVLRESGVIAPLERLASLLSHLPSLHPFLARRPIYLNFESSSCMSARSACGTQAPLSLVLSGSVQLVGHCSGPGNSRCRLWTSLLSPF